MVGRQTATCAADAAAQSYGSKPPNKKREALGAAHEWQLHNVV